MLEGVVDRSSRVDVCLSHNTQTIATLTIIEEGVGDHRDQASPGCWHHHWLMFVSVVTPMSRRTCGGSHKRDSKHLALASMIGVPTSLNS